MLRHILYHICYWSACLTHAKLNICSTSFWILILHSAANSEIFYSNFTQEKENFHPIFKNAQEENYLIMPFSLKHLLIQACNLHFILCLKKPYSLSIKYQDYIFSCFLNDFYLCLVELFMEEGKQEKFKEQWLELENLVTEVPCFVTKRWTEVRGTSQNKCKKGIWRINLLCYMCCHMVHYID